MTQIARKLVLRIDLIANIPVLLPGEPFYASDTNDFYMGTLNGNVKQNINYTPAAPSSWANPAPTNLINAMDRLTAVVHALYGGPIP